MAQLFKVLAALLEDHSQQPHDSSQLSGFRGADSLFCAPLAPGMYVVQNIHIHKMFLKLNKQKMLQPRFP